METVCVRLFRTYVGGLFFLGLSSIDDRVVYSKKNDLQLNIPFLSFIAHCDRRLSEVLPGGYISEKIGSAKSGNMVFADLR